MAKPLRVSGPKEISYRAEVAVRRKGALGYSTIMAQPREDMRAGNKVRHKTKRLRYYGS